MGLIGWLLVGATAGWLAGKATGGGYGILGNTVVGIIGSLLGGFLGSALFGWDVTGLNVGSIVLAFLGAVLFLLILRAIPGPGFRSSPTDAPTVQQSTNRTHANTRPRISPVTSPTIPTTRRPEEPLEVKTTGVDPLVFISAKSDDYSYASQVFELLQRHGVRVFLSSESLPQLGDADYRKAITRALKEAEHMVVVTTSKEHVESGWVDYESGIFHNEKLSGKKSGNIITVTYGALKPEELPYHLNYYQVIRADTEGIDRVLNYIIK